jgi:lipoprotein-releasing system ATP-binding protein
MSGVDAVRAPENGGGAGGPLSVRATALVKHYRTDAGPVSVLREFSLAVAAGEKLAVTGESGVGKSTLLQLIGALDAPDAGEIFIGDQSVNGLDAAARAELRRRQIGFVFQFHHLLAEFSARENVLMPACIAGAENGAAKARADELLKRLGLADRATHRPSQLSGGEQQRCAIARALILRPGLILADEPTGNLDPKTGGEVFDLLLELAAERTFTLIVATHNPELAARCDRVVHMTR